MKKKNKKKVVKSERSVVIQLKEHLNKANSQITEYSSFMKTLQSMLGCPGSEGFGLSYFRQEPTTGERIIGAITKLQEYYHREDEGTKCQAETISILTDALHTSMNDPVRLIKVQNEKEFVLNGFIKDRPGNEANWIKNRN